MRAARAGEVDAIVMDTGHGEHAEHERERRHHDRPEAQPRRLDGGTNDRLLLGLKGSLNEYELDLLRQRSLSARYEKARRGELVVAAPVGFVKAGDRSGEGRFGTDPARHVDRRRRRGLRLATRL